jgi:predicted AAA+ superfamily ATPase
MLDYLDYLTGRFITLISNFNIEYRRYFFDLVDFNDKLIGILGPRGVGKTTFLLQYLKDLDLPISKKLYFSADSIETSDASLFEIADIFAKNDGEILVIDEIHKYPNFEKELKQIYDYLPLKVIFSGSSAVTLENSKSDLSRRAVLYRIKGLSFREFLELKTNKKFKTFKIEEIVNNHTDIVYEILQEIKPFKFFKEYLQKGFYPFYFENPNTYYKKLEETINVVIESDLPFVFGIDTKNTIKLKKLVKLVCESEPFEINITKLAQKMEIDRSTLYQYINYLNLGNILNILKSKTRGDSIFAKPEKIYLHNTNLNYCYCEEQKIGTIRETFIVSQLIYFYDLKYPRKGDLIVDKKYTFEIGGKNKDFSQIKENGFLILDDIESGNRRKIPLWLFGFLY